MTFQAYRCISNVYNLFTRSLPFGGFIPAAPVRSSFAEAFSDVRELRNSGYAASVRLISSTNQL